MSVSSVGGPASLPVPLPLPPIAAAHVPANGAGTALTASARTSSAAGTSSSTAEVRLPGQHASKAKESPAPTVPKEPPKPAPLPPLKGLTLAEIRAMLGVARLPAGTDATAPASVQAAVNRYA